MFIYTHAGVGWALAEAGKSDRRFRAAVFFASVLPDLDGLLYFFGQRLYTAYHHMWTHGLLFSVVVSLVAAWACKTSRLKTLVFTQLAFYSHYVGDYFFTQWGLYYFWPFSDKMFYFQHAVWLQHPLNYGLVGMAVLLVAALAVRYKRTPVEVISPALDERIVNMLFRRKNHCCHICGKKSNESCSSCGESVCLRHGTLDRHWSVTCSTCKQQQVEASQ